MTEQPDPHLDEEGDVLPEDYSEQIPAEIILDEYGRTPQDIRASVAYMTLALSLIRQYKGPPNELRWWWSESKDHRLSATLISEQEEELIRACVARIEWLRMHPPRKKRRLKMKAQ